MSVQINGKCAFLNMICFYQANCSLLAVLQILVNELCDLLNACQSVSFIETRHVGWLLSHRGRVLVFIAFATIFPIWP